MGRVQPFLTEKQKELTHSSLRDAITKNLSRRTFADDYEQKLINHILLLAP